MPALHFVLPGDPATRTGGYAYDRRIAAGLRALGWTVDVHALGAGFPQPSPAEVAHAAAVLAALPDGARVLIDGLALGAMPENAVRESDRLRLVALVHHPLAAETGLAATAAAALRSSERRALAAVRRVVVSSRATARALAEYGVAAERIDVVEPGTDPAPLARGSGDGQVALLCVAAVVPRKGHDVLVEALAALADRPWRLDCVGPLDRDPAAAARLAAAIARHGLEPRIRLHGELDDPALAARYAAADVFVLPTRHEGYGMALAEALAHGLPVIGTTAGAVPDTVPPDAGLLVPVDDVHALGEALAQLMDNRDLRERLATGARRARGTLPTWAAAAQRMAAVLSP